MTHNLRGNTQLNGSIMACYLAEDSARITSSHFKVYIPSIMGEIAKDQEEIKERCNTKAMLNESNSADFEKEVNCQGYIVAKSIHPYRIRHDGWIPKFTIDTLSAENGSVENITASESEAEPKDGEIVFPLKPFTRLLKMFKNSLKSIVFSKLIATNSKEIDYQELNNKFIKRGHLMYGCFVAGLQNQFVIIAIDDAIPYKDQKEPGGLMDNPDTSFDGGVNNPGN